MKKLSMVLAAAALSAVSTVAQAQTTCGPDGVGQLAVNATACSQSHTLTSTVNDILRLTVSTTTTGLGTPLSTNYGAAADYLTTATPLSAATGPNVKVVANRPYEISIAAAAATFTTTPYAGFAGSVNKPTSDVQWGKGASPTFVALSTSAASVFAGSTGTADTNTGLSFRSRWNYERDVPGDYSMTVTLTLAAK